MGCVALKMRNCLKVKIVMSHINKIIIFFYVTNYGACCLIQFNSTASIIITIAPNCLLTETASCARRSATGCRGHTNVEGILGHRLLLPAIQMRTVFGDKNHFEVASAN